MVALGTYIPIIRGGYESYSDLQFAWNPLAGRGRDLQAQMPMGETEKMVAAQERQWLQSQKTKNADLLTPLLAEKFVSTGADGKVTNKAQSVAAAKADHGPAPSMRTWRS